MLVWKLVLTPALIAAASLAGRRWGHAVSGWLVGLPLTSGPVALFLALERGTTFAADASLGSLAGSFVSNNIEDYYTNPYELGYGPFVKFDHDFIGREELEKISKHPQRHKVTFAWNQDDVLKVFTSLLEGGDPYKFLDMPLTNYGSSSYDAVRKGSKNVGFSMFAGYSYNERSFLSLGIVDPDVKNGDELVLVWGEENGGTKKARRSPGVTRALPPKQPTCV